VNPAENGTHTPAWRRAEILGFASGLLTSSSRQHPVAVLIAALPLLVWAEKASDPDDLRARMSAMRRQHRNMLEPKVNVDPDEFLAQARVYYQFLTEGGE
jgi:hypothetical protein